MTRARRLLPCGFLLAGFAAGTTARAAEPQFAITSYLWMAGVTGTLGTTIPGTATQRMEADFGDVLSHLNGIPVMLAGEFRQGRFGVLADAMAISVETDADTPGNAFAGGRARLRQVIGSVLFAWRVADAGSGVLDLGAGLRAFGVSTRLTLEPGALPGQRFDRDDNWVNPILGLRYRHQIAEGWSATLYGDIGGASGDLTWQAMATLDYRLSDRMTLRAGYRWLSFDRESGLLRQDMGLGGPILGATLRF